MDENKRIVIDDVPIERLPEDLRGGIEAGHRVRVIVEDRTEASEAVPRFRRFHGIAAYRNTSIAEAVDRVRALRDEWD